MNKQIKPCKHDDGGHGKICDQNYDCKNCEYYKDKIRKEEEYYNEWCYWEKNSNNIKTK